MGLRQQQIMNNYWQKGTQNGTKTATNNEQLPIGKREHIMRLRLQQIMNKFQHQGAKNETTVRLQQIISATEKGNHNYNNNEQISAKGRKEWDKDCKK